MSSEEKRRANRANARKSTGPKSAQGKKAVSQNARRHGILSTHLVLEGESREDFDRLLATLQAELSPVGLLEMTLVERIAVSMWRQRRLVRAESAEVALRQRNVAADDLKAISISLGVSVTDTRFKEAINLPYVGKEGKNSENLGNWLASLVDVLEDQTWSSLEEIEALSPDTYDVLLSCADEPTPEALERYLVENSDTLRELLERLVKVYRRTYDDRRIRELADLYRDAAQIRASVDVIGRYQSALDNELYKAMRALREAQTWRQSRIDAEARRVNESTGE